jgi:hypothetical protein
MLLARDIAHGDVVAALISDKTHEALAILQIDHLRTETLGSGLYRSFGDFIDRDFESFDVVGPIFNKLRMPKYHVLGKHDFSVEDHLNPTFPT